MNVVEENRQLETRIQNKKLVEYCCRGIPPNQDKAQVCNFLYKQILGNDKHYSRQIGKHTTVSGKKILDIGSGSGFDAIDLTQEGAWVVAFEYSSGRLEFNQELQKEKGVKHPIVKGDACHLPFKPGVFDIVSSKHLIEHLPQPEQRLKDMAKVLSTTGFIYMNYPNRYAIRQIFRDDHYNLPLVVLLPRPSAKFIVTRIMKYEKEYSTNVFLSKPWCDRMVADAGLSCRYVLPDMAILESKVQEPGTINNAPTRMLLILFKKTGLSHLFIAFMKTTLFQSLAFPNFTIMASKVISGRAE